ncbi:uncharacterized protein LOC120306720 [Crotalus tigris]|uniref:uncharacterized protein LOC120306720 n=1 Tax=Crotalus tigris TaxID=88082 RepID=UPI00192F4FC9|nr:uncharacterized protein LOC120306720 [Crotalus tigris]
MEDSSRSYYPYSGGTSAPGPTVAPTNHLALERRALTRDSYSSRVIAMIQQSRRPSTNRIYDATWTNFCTWCSGRKVELLDISVPIVLEFLMDGLDKGLSPSTIRRQVAALSTVLMCDNSAPLVHHLMMRSFLKGATNARPPAVHRYPSWDLHWVLQALISPPFKPITTCLLKLLSMKVAFLVAVTSARQISELAALSVREDLCIFHADRVTLRLDPSFIPKINFLYHRSQEVVLPNFCANPSHDLEKRWHTLDIRRALRRYIKRTSAFHKSEALFVSFQPSSMG